MKLFGLNRLAGLLLAATIAGAPIAAPAFAQDATPAPAAAAAAPAAAPAAAEAPAPVAAAPAAAEAPAPAAAAPAAPAEEAKPWAPDSGDTAWMLTSTALVLLMTIPALGLFYGGMVRRKNVLATITQSFAITALVTVIWMVLTYSLAFTTNADPGLNKYIGGFDRFLMNGLKMDVPHPLAGTIPESVFMMFQMTFAIITPALIAGAFAERMKFSGMMLFMALWSIVVYAPIAHWVWGGGFLGGAGVLDFAGGTVVHINAGVAGLVCALVLGKRKGYGTDNMAPHNLVLTMIGASMLWVGWFGFNAGSAVASNALAGHKGSSLGFCSGIVAGLVAVTPAAGNSGPFGAIVLGAIASFVCFFAVSVVKPKLGYDDALDAFGVHGIGGMIGAIGTGIVYSSTLGGPSKPDFDMGHQLLVQFETVGTTIVWAAVGTAIAITVARLVTGLRVSREVEFEGLDIGEHGERAYNY